jgi:phosphate transport system protein
MPRPFEEEFQHLNSSLREMGSLVAHSVQRSVLALVEKDPDYAHQVIRDEQRIDQMEIRIEELATSLIVREQPVARDMRLIVSAIKITTDLERMGDLAVHIAERALWLMVQPPLPEDIHFGEITSLVESMVLGSLDSFVKGDSDVARGILEVDNTVDRARTRIQQQLIELMQRQPATIPRAIEYLIIARKLERIGDHATNIAEDVIFMTQGIDVRHRFAAEAVQAENTLEG